MERDGICRPALLTLMEHAGARRDPAVELLKAAKSEEERARRLETQQEDLNRLCVPCRGGLSLETLA